MVRMFGQEPLASPPESQPLTPVARQDRTAAMDVLRGVSVFGIFLINMPLFVAPLPAFFQWESNPLWTENSDRIVTLLIYIFAQGKFYTLFSFLFGVGFGVQLLRARKINAENFKRVYRRRLAVLLGLGLLHFFAIWWGDVLHVYALLGFLLFVFYERTDKVLWVWVLSLTLVPLSLALIGTTVQHLTRKESSVARDLRLLRAHENSVREVRKNIEIYQSSSVTTILRDRAKFNVNHMASEVGWSIELLGNFLLGLLAARRRVFAEPERHLPMLRRLAFAGFPVALLLTTADQLYGYWHPGEPDPLWRAQLSLVREFLCRPLMALGYAAILLLIGARPWMSPFAAVGRMALTNYLLHSLTFTTVALSYGLAQYGKIPPAKGLLYCVAFYALQLPFSVWWLRGHTYGPVEWLWRSLTYGERQPWRRV